MRPPVPSPSLLLLVGACGAPPLADTAPDRDTDRPADTDVPSETDARIDTAEPADTDVPVDTDADTDVPEPAASAPGDFDGDGWNERVYTFFDNATWKGTVYLFQGKVDLRTATTADAAMRMSGWRLGVWISVCDIDGDGLDDFLVTERTDVFAFLGSSWPDWSWHDLQFTTARDETTAAPVCADLTGDGADDLTRALIDDARNRAVDVYPGGAHLVSGAVIDLDSDGAVVTVQPPDDATARFGDSLAVADLHGDGAADLLVGDTYHDTFGAIFGYAGGSGFGHEDFRIYGPRIDKGFGQTIATGDFDDDGDDDVVACDFAPCDHVTVLRGEPVSAGVLPARDLSVTDDLGLARGASLDDWYVGPDAYVFLSVIDDPSDLGVFAIDASGGLSAVGRHTLAGYYCYPLASDTDPLCYGREGEPLLHLALDGTGGITVTETLLVRDSDLSVFGLTLAPY